MTEYCQNCGVKWGVFGHNGLWFCQKCDEKLQTMTADQKENALEKVKHNVRQQSTIKNH